jgi:hypothetical protein
LPDRQGIERLRIVLALQEIDSCAEPLQSPQAEQ